MSKEQNKVIPAIVDDLKLVFHSHQGRSLSDAEANLLLRGLVSFRDIEKALLEYPRNVFGCLFAHNSFYGRCYYPCDIIDLRDILEEGKIKSNSGGIVLFSNKAWNDIIKTNKAILVLKIDPEETDALIVGGVALLPRDHLDVKTNIESVILQRKSPYEIVEKIVADTMPGLPIYDISYVPQIQPEKFASSQHNYVISLPALQLYNQYIRAESPVEALDIALIRRWTRYSKQNKDRQRPPRYTAEYWLRSGFFDSIVRDTSAPKKNRKS